MALVGLRLVLLFLVGDSAADFLESRIRNRVFMYPGPYRTLAEDVQESGIVNAKCARHSGAHEKRASGQPDLTPTFK
ncbi:uncharacterized protein LOC129657902 isoform X2 [Bubalus kerabau]|uniref:uncharacterized protein LOC129657902 isoform X2 n=1 Tax=Bubalus carabanensis TaxID=3119969 RepID=UPI00244E649C|nr:uncharacterized protein LOC129657902 isoform X2 [Bubalus carabanensis]